MKRPNKGIKRIVIATSMVIFVLLGCVTGTYAWFVAMGSYQTTVSHFRVMALDMSVDSVTLYKFDYASDGLGGYDYLAPQDGSVGAYSYNSTQGSFGYNVHNDQTGEDDWMPVTTMNLYDPLAGFITGHGLLGLNCNAVFKIVLHSNNLTSIEVDVRAASIPDPSKETDDIWLSTCVDFDLFLPSDLSDARLVTNTTRNYLPNQSDEYLPNNYVFQTQYEEDYYKFSYLASLKSSHPHLYADAHQSTLTNVSIGTTTINFVAGYATVYVNVNYAPSQLKHYEETVTPDETIRAKYDFLLEIR